MSEDANCLKQALIHMPNLENLDLSDNSVENGFRLVGLHLSDSMWDDWGLIFFWSFLYTLSKYNTIYHFKYNRDTKWPLQPLILYELIWLKNDFQGCDRLFYWDLWQRLTLCWSEAWELWTDLQPSGWAFRSSFSYEKTA